MLEIFWNSNIKYKKIKQNRKLNLALESCLYKKECTVKLAIFGSK